MLIAISPSKDSEYQHAVCVASSEDDLNIHGVASLLWHMLVGFGYLPETVDKILPTAQEEV